MSHLNTRLLDMVTDYHSKFDATENRITKFPLLKAFREDTNHPDAVVDESIKAGFAASNFRSGFSIPVMNRFTPVLGTTRSCTLTDPETSTALQAVTTSIHSWSFSIVPSENEGNYVKEQKEFQQKYKLGMEQVGKTVETGCAASLATNRSQIDNSPYTGAGAERYGDFEAADQIAVSALQINGFFNDVESIMNYNDFYTDDGGNFNVFASATLRSTVNTLAAGGEQNATNTKYQLPGLDFIYSTRISPGTGFAAGYIVPKGQVGILSRTAWEHRQAGDVVAGTKIFSSTVDHITGFTLGTLYYTECVDQSNRFGQGLGYNTAALTERYGFNLEVATFTPYNSAPATLAGPIVGFQMANA